MKKLLPLIILLYASRALAAPITLTQSLDFSNSPVTIFPNDVPFHFSIDFGQRFSSFENIQFIADIVSPVAGTKLGIRHGLDGYRANVATGVPNDYFWRKGLTSSAEMIRRGFESTALDILDGSFRYFVSMNYDCSKPRPPNTGCSTPQGDSITFSRLGVTIVNAEPVAEPGILGLLSLGLLGLAVTRRRQPR